MTLTPGGNAIDSIIQTLQNVGEAKVKGVDIEFNYRENFGPGRLDVNLMGTYMDQFDQTSPGGALSRKVGTMVEPDGTPVLSTQSNAMRWRRAALEAPPRRHVVAGRRGRSRWRRTTTTAIATATT